MIGHEAVRRMTDRTGRRVMVFLMVLEEILAMDGLGHQEKIAGHQNSGKRYPPMLKSGTISK
jgi:hypothetical protein